MSTCYMCLLCNPPPLPRCNTTLPQPPPPPILPPAPSNTSTFNFWLWTQQQTGLNWTDSSSRADLWLQWFICPRISEELQFRAPAVSFMFSSRSGYWHTDTQCRWWASTVRAAPLTCNMYTCSQCAFLEINCARMHANSRPEGCEHNTM